MLLTSKNDFQWATNILNMHKSAKNKILHQLNENDLNTAVQFFNQKYFFDKQVSSDLDKSINSLYKTMDASFSNLTQTYTQTYNMKSIVNKAQQTIRNYQKESTQFIDNFVQGKFNLKLKAHPKEGQITCILDVYDKLLLTSSQDGNIVGWAKPTYKQEFRLKEKSPVNSMAYLKHQDIEYLLISNQTEISVYNLNTRNRIYKLKGHTNTINKIVALHSYYALSCSQDGTLRLWDIQNRNELLSVVKNSAILDMELVGKYVVAGTVAGYILILDPYTLKTIHSIKDNAGSVYSICPLNNEEFAISTSAGRVKIYLTNGTEKMDIPVTTELIYKVIKLTQRYLLCLSQDQRLNLIDLDYISKIKKIKIYNNQWQTLHYNGEWLMIPEKGDIKMFK